MNWRMTKEADCVSRQSRIVAAPKQRNRRKDNAKVGEAPAKLKDKTTILHQKD